MIDNDNDDGLGHRHLLGTAGIGQPGSRPGFRVRIVAPASWATTKSGQIIVSTLVNLLCRQVSVVCHIEIDMPSVSAHILMPDGSMFARFSDAVAALPRWAVDNKVTLSFCCSDAPPDFTVFVGGSSGHAAGRAITVLGDGWRAWVGDPAHSPTNVRPTSDNALGPMLAAALGAGEVFKRHCGLTRGKFLTAATYSLWSGETSGHWGAVADGPSVDRCAIPPFFLMGAGAVGNDVAYILGYLMVSPYAVLVDSQAYSWTNLNRCLISGWNDCTHDKVESVARFLGACGIDSFPFRGTVKEFVAAPWTGLRDDVNKDVGDLKFGIVLSCVDNSLARHDIQGLAPTLLLGGSSLGLQAKTQYYSGCSGAPCLACFHPVEPNAERFADLKQQLTALDMEARRAFLIANKLDVDAVERYLRDPDCGGFGEAALRDFVTAPPDEFSVSFVSLGSALLLVASLLRRTVFAHAARAREDFSTLNFLNGNLHDHAVAADDGCQRHCQLSRRIGAD